MLRRLIVVTALAAGMSIAAAITLAAPALAKGPSQARITGPGLAHPIVISGNGEPGQPGVLGTLALQTRLFIVMFGPNATVPSQAPPQLRTPPPAASLGPRYTIIYTVYGEYTGPGQLFGHIRQDLYPRADGGPVIFTPPSQPGGPLPVFGWLRAGRHLPRTLAKLGVPPRPGTQAAPQTRLTPAAHPAAAQQTGSPTLAWLIASAAAIAVLAGAALWLRRRRPATAQDSAEPPAPAGPVSAI
jgi:hypothetical protein